jgi:hypothetical protein
LTEEGIDGYFGIDCCTGGTNAPSSMALCTAFVCWLSVITREIEGRFSPAVFSAE